MMTQAQVAEENYKEVSRLDDEERQRLVMENLPEVNYIARRIHNRVPKHISLEELMSAGVVGLLEAIDHYDADRKTKLMTFAKLRIEGAILDSLRQLDWSPRSLRKKSREVEDALRRLRLRMERAPSLNELADEMGMSGEAMDGLLCELRGIELGSLEALEGQNENGDPLCHYQPASSEDDPLCVCLQSELRECLTRAVSHLPERERQVIALYYVEELTMKEVGAVLGVREARVSQIHSAALLRLRSLMQEFIASRQAPRSQSRINAEHYNGQRS